MFSRGPLRASKSEVTFDFKFAGHFDSGEWFLVETPCQNVDSYWCSEPNRFKWTRWSLHSSLKSLSLQFSGGADKFRHHCWLTDKSSRSITQMIASTDYPTIRIATQGRECSFSVLFARENWMAILNHLDTAVCTIQMAMYNPNSNADCDGLQMIRNPFISRPFPNLCERTLELFAITVDSLVEGL